MDSAIYQIKDTFLLCKYTRNCQLRIQLQDQESGKFPPRHSQSMMRHYHRKDLYIVEVRTTISRFWELS